MLKLVGSSLILTAAFGIAYRFHGELELQLKMLYGIRRMFVELQQQMKLTLLPMEQILGEIKGDERLVEICTQIAEELTVRQGEAPEEIWRESFLRQGRKLGITKEELQVAAEAGSAFFGKNLEENERKLALYLEQMDFMIETVRAKQKEKQRVYQTVSILGGMMLIILLI